MTGMDEDRLIAIEMKISAQEDMLDSLNQVIYRQQKKIDHLETMLAALVKHLKQLQEATQDIGSGNERPPHY
jgi:SlyX protein